MLCINSHSGLPGTPCLCACARGCVCSCVWGAGGEVGGWKGKFPNFVEFFALILLWRHQSFSFYLSRMKLYLNHKMTETLIRTTTTTSQKQPDQQRPEPPGYPGLSRPPGPAADSLGELISSVHVDNVRWQTHGWISEAAAIRHRKT